MLPKVSPNSSLKNGPIASRGSVALTSPTFLRTWYQSGWHVACERRLNRLRGEDHLRLARPRVRADVFVVAGLHHRFFSIRSVTCCATSSAVAPGHTVRTTIALKVKGGSSDWPRWRYDHAADACPASSSRTAPGVRLRQRPLGEVEAAHGGLLRPRGDVAAPPPPRASAADCCGPPARRVVLRATGVRRPRPPSPIRLEAAEYGHRGFAIAAPNCTD
jgi:hypothetical protein